MTGVPMLCGFSAAFLHYFMLVFFTWTAVEAIWLYIKLVKVFGTQSLESHYIIKSGVPAWGELNSCYFDTAMVTIFNLPFVVLPLLIVALSVGPGYNYYISQY